MCCVQYNYFMPDDQTLSDEKLVLEIRTRDKQKFRELVKRYQDKLVRYAVYLLGDEQKAVDTVQEAFIKTYINLNGFDTKKQFSSWIYRIVHNEAMNSLKKYSRETRFTPDMDFRSDQDLELDLSRKETVKKVRNCLKKMPVMYSEPLALSHLEDKSYEEISDILRIPMGTVAVRINRAKGIMKNLCQK